MVRAQQSSQGQGRYTRREGHRRGCNRRHGRRYRDSLLARGSVPSEGVRGDIGEGRREIAHGAIALRATVEAIGLVLAKATARATLSPISASKKLGAVIAK